MTLTLLLLAFAGVGLVAMFLRMGSMVPGAGARGAVVLFVAVVLAAALATSDGLFELLAVLAYLALCGLGIAQLIDWFKQPPSGSPKTSHHLSGGRSPARKAAPPRPRSARPTKARSAPRPPAVDRRADLADRLEAARADEARGDPAAAHRVGLFLEQSGDLEGAEEAYHRAEASGDPHGADGLAELYALRGDSNAARHAELRADELRRLRGPPRPGRQRREPRPQRQRRARAPRAVHVPSVADEAPARPPQQRCSRHHDKVEFATEAAAREFVEWTQTRYATGKTDMPPMDHWYACPVAGQDHWHVSSKPRIG